MNDAHSIRLLVPIAVGSVAVICSILIHALVLSATVIMLRRKNKLGHLGFNYRKDVGVVMRVILYALAAHLLEMAVWATLFVFCGEFSTFAAAYYHSAVTYTSCARNDVFDLRAPATVSHPMSHHSCKHLVCQAGVLTAVIFATAPLFPLLAFSNESVEAPDKNDFSVFDPTPDDLMRAFSTDRPPKANSPYTVDAGHFQYETDLALFGYGTANGITTHDWTALDPTLKIGLTNTIDAELQITPYESVTTKSASGRVNIAGVGDTVGRIKVNVLGDDQGSLSIALLPYIKFPTARYGLGNGKVEGGIILPMSVGAPGGFTIILMPEGDILKDDAGNGYHAAIDFLVNVSHPLGIRWTIYTEIFTTQYFDARDSPLYTLDEALTYILTPNLQIDFGGNFGLNGVTPRNQVYAGLSQRF